MHYTYVLYSEKDQKNYVGYTEDLRARLKQHDQGSVISTKHRRPLRLIYFEACVDKKDAMKREKYLKTHYGRMYLKKRLAGFLSEID
ncbi:GIY-YIG nuclease family protein [Marinoscillum luteum]|uniref:GIY-YIG nuclease family protein n=1 Tax=Marinoscillum luteum TaxID=861051 RepID=A0ABW7N7W1_9BACT